MRTNIVPGIIHDSDLIEKQKRWVEWSRVHAVKKGTRLVLHKLSWALYLWAMGVMRCKVWQGNMFWLLGWTLPALEHWGDGHRGEECERGHELDEQQDARSEQTRHHSGSCSESSRDHTEDSGKWNCISIIKRTGNNVYMSRTGVIIEGASCAFSFICRSWRRFAVLWWTEPNPKLRSQQRITGLTTVLQQDMGLKAMATSRLRTMERWKWTELLI